MHLSRSLQNLVHQILPSSFLWIVSHFDNFHRNKIHVVGYFTNLSFRWHKILYPGLCLQYMKWNIRMYKREEKSFKHKNCVTCLQKFLVSISCHFIICTQSSCSSLFPNYSSIKILGSSVMFIKGEPKDVLMTAKTGVFLLRFSVKLSWLKGSNSI
jgi:hypothetical protein